MWLERNDLGYGNRQTDNRQMDRQPQNQEDTQKKRERERVRARKRKR